MTYKAANINDRINLRYALSRDIDPYLCHLMNICLMAYKLPRAFIIIWP